MTVNARRWGWPGEGGGSMKSYDNLYFIWGDCEVALLSLAMARAGEGGNYKIKPTLQIPVGLKAKLKFENYCSTFLCKLFINLRDQLLVEKFLTCWSLYRIAETFPKLYCSKL